MTPSGGFQQVLVEGLAMAAFGFALVVAPRPIVVESQMIRSRSGCAVMRF